MLEPQEPQIHSHATDVLPEDHPLAWTTVFCKRCDLMLHAFNNECMSTWVETGRGNYCIRCFVSVADEDPIGQYHGGGVEGLAWYWGLGPVVPTECEAALT